MEFPNPTSSSGSTSHDNAAPRGQGWDIRNDLNPRRLTMIMWDTAYIQRHHKGGSFENYDAILDQAVERGYNTISIDPMPQVIDLANPGREIHFPDPQQLYMPWCGNCENRGHAGEWLIGLKDYYDSNKRY